MPRRHASRHAEPSDWIDFCQKFRYTVSNYLVFSMRDPEQYLRDIQAAEDAVNSPTNKTEAQKERAAANQETHTDLDSLAAEMAERTRRATEQQKNPKPYGLGRTGIDKMRARDVVEGVNPNQLNVAKDSGNGIERSFNDVERGKKAEEVLLTSLERAWGADPSKLRDVTGPYEENVDVLLAELAGQFGMTEKRLGEQVDRFNTMDGGLDWA